MNIVHIVARLTVLAIFMAATAARSSELDERIAVRKEAEAYYRAGDFNSLDRLHSRYSDFLHQRTSSGAFKMTLFFDGIEEATRDTTEAERQQDIERTQGWVTEHKTSPLAYVLHAVALLTYGEYFRGTGYADTVPPQAWKVYEEYTQKAVKYLVENESIASKSTTWHVWMLNLARISGWPYDVVQRLFEDGLKKNPANFSLYRNVLEYLLPKWHGDARAVDGFIRNAVEKAPSEYGPELYARLYSAAGEEQFKRRLYTDSLVDWKTMQEGLQLWYRRFPTDWNRNIVAYHACIAGDQVVAKQVLSEIGAQPQWEIWEPNAKATFDTCLRWANQPLAEPAALPKKQPEGATS